MLTAIATKPSPLARLVRFCRIAALRYELSSNERYLQMLERTGYPLDAVELAAWRRLLETQRVRLIVLEGGR